MENLVKTLRNGDQVLEIFYDTNPASPREWDNLGTIVTKKNHHYTIGDQQVEDIDEFLQSQGDIVKVPVYMIDHSGISLSTRDFNDPWDSGMIGYIFATKEKIKNEYSVKRITKKTLTKVENIFNGELDTYDQYVNGNVYGFVLSKVSECDHNEEHKKHIDSCWGFYGDDLISNGIADYVENFEKFKEI
ncbi:hypothetical protein [Nitrosopumilus sp.]|uniref:hypothetical protein n=1 Tax=Nitrosopumilus sp. TaxID=2024843 RepID=UPI003D0C4FCB